MEVIRRVKILSSLPDFVMKNSIFLLLTTLFVISYVVEGSVGLPSDLRNEFHVLASSRLKTVLKHVSLKNSSYLSMSFIVTECQVSPINTTIKQTSGGQLLLEEVTCGTVRMQEWCGRQPGRSGVLMTEDEKWNGTVMARFLCDTEHPYSSASSHVDKLRIAIYILYPIALIGLAVAWYAKLTHPVPIHPSNILNLTNKSDSFENITLNSSKATPNKSLSFSSFRSYFSSFPKKFRIIV